MKKLTEVETPEVKTSETPQAETKGLSDLLSSYAEASQEIPEENQNSTGHSLPQEVKQVSNEPVQWQGNPLYYQTGKKAGQLRPSVSRPKVDVVPNNTPTTISGDIISGALFMTMIDLLLPMAFVTANNYFSKVKIKPDDLELTAKQKSELEPIAEKVAAQVRLTANPTVVLIFTLAGIYGMNFMKAKINAEAKLVLKKDANK